MKIQCPSCNAIFDAPNNYMGKKVKCPKCKNPFEAIGKAVLEPVVVIPEKTDYKAISDFPENGMANSFRAIGWVVFVIGIIALISGVMATSEIVIISALGTILSSIWFFGASAIICAIGRNTLEVHLLRKQQKADKQ